MRLFGRCKAHSFSCIHPFRKCDYCAYFQAQKAVLSYMQSNKTKPKKDATPTIHFKYIERKKGVPERQKILKLRSVEVGVGYVEMFLETSRIDSLKIGQASRS